MLFIVRYNQDESYNGQLTFHFQLPVSHDDTFGDYTCIASNKMGTLRKVVTLSEGAKPGIPHIHINKIGHETADVKIEVRT